MATWTPSDDQANNLINPSWDLITEELQQLQQSLGCPDSYIAGMIQAIALDWQETPHD